MTETKTREMHDYVTRLSDKTGQSWGKKLITLPDDLHAKMVEEAKNLDIPMYEAYIQAARLWLKSRGITAAIGTDALTGDEEAFIQETLGLYRNRKRHREYGDAVDMITGLIKLAKSSVSQ